MSDEHPTLAEVRALHEDLLAACREERTARYRLAQLLQRVQRDRLYRVLGFSTMGAYVEEALGLSSRQACELLRIAGRLLELPALDEALANGELEWTKAREVVRVAVPETERAWTERAKDLTSRELERQVRVSKMGDAPPQPDEPLRGPARRRIAIEMEASDAELLFQAMALIRAQAGVSSAERDDGVILAEIARRVLASPDNAPEDAPNGEPYRVLLEHCPSCARTTSPENDVSETIVAEACCDAEVVDLSEGPTHGHASRTVPPASRRAVLGRDRYRCAVPHCRNRLFLHLHHTRSRADGGTHDVGNLVTLCSIHHRAVHDGVLRVEWNAEQKLVVEHVDGRKYVGTRSVGPVINGPPRARTGFTLLRRARWTPDGRPVLRGDSAAPEGA